MQAVPIVLGALLLAALLFAVGAALRGRDSGPRKRQLRASAQTLAEIEGYVLDQLQIDSQDLTAHRVAGIIRNARQKELS